MITLTKELIGDAVESAIPTIACVLPRDVRDSLASARNSEPQGRGAFVLDQLLANAEIAASDQAPFGCAWRLGPIALSQVTCSIAWTLLLRAPMMRQPSEKASSAMRCSIEPIPATIRLHSAISI